MGVETNRIETEFILKSIIEKDLPVNIHLRKNIINARVRKYNLDKNVILEIKNNDDNIPFNPDDSVNIYFSYFSHVMNFKAKVLKTGEDLQISYPKKVFKNLSRKYVRVPPPENSKIVFSVKGEKFQLDFPKTDEFNAVDVADFNTDDYAVSNISQLINDFRRKMLETASTINIVTYRKQKPEALEETLISKSGKTLYIPSTNQELPEFVEVGDVPVLTGELIDSIEPEGQKQIKTKNFEKSSQGIHSEIFCPVLYLEYVVGHIHVQNNDNNKSLLSPDTLEYVYQFSKVLAFSLKINGYFKDKVVAYEKYESTIIDISAAGLLFSSNSKKLDKSFYLYTDLSVDLFIGEKIIPIACRIMRKYKSDDTVFYGLIFLDINESDFEELFYLVYGRNVTEEDLKQWEGGSAPPKVDL